MPISSQMVEKQLNQAVTFLTTSFAHVLMDEVTNTLQKAFKLKTVSCRSDARVGTIIKQRNVKAIQFQWEKLHRNLLMGPISWKQVEVLDLQDF